MQRHIEEKLYGSAPLDNPLLRVKLWVQSVEEAISTGVPPQVVADQLHVEVPPEAYNGFLMAPVESTVQELVSFATDNQGIINSEKGIRYLKEVQAILIARHNGS